jgi:hypothetical protein
VDDVCALWSVGLYSIACGCMRMNSTIDSFETAHYGNLLQNAGATERVFNNLFTLL